MKLNNREIRDCIGNHVDLSIGKLMKKAGIESGDFPPEKWLEYEDLLDRISDIAEYIIQFNKENENMEIIQFNKEDENTIEFLEARV